LFQNPKRMQHFFFKPSTFDPLETCTLHHAISWINRRVEIIWSGISGVYYVQYTEEDIDGYHYKQRKYWFWKLTSFFAEKKNNSRGNINNKNIMREALFFICWMKIFKLLSFVQFFVPSLFWKAEKQYLLQALCIVFF
jgi:hypothetical protein